jgi:hypothetical protein
MLLFNQKNKPIQSMKINSIKNVKQSVTCEKYEETFECIKRCIKKTRAWDREQTRNTLDQHQESLQTIIKLFLFHRPLLAIVVFGLAYFLFVWITAIIIVYVAMKFDGKTEAYIRQAGLLIILIPYIFLSIKMHVMTPRSQVGYDERWKKTLDFFLNELDVSSVGKAHNTQAEKFREAKRRLKISIGHYLREGEVLKFFLNLIWGGIFIGCLPDKEFQDALLTLSAESIFNANRFGAICLFIAPLVFGYYFLKCILPSAWMQQVVDQIELYE